MSGDDTKNTVAGRELPAAEWQLIEHIDAAEERHDSPTPPPHPEAPSSGTGFAPRKPQGAVAVEKGPPEALATKVLYCLLCCLEALVKLTTAATQVLRGTAVAVAHLLHQLQAAAGPLLSSIHREARQYIVLLRRRDMRAAGHLAAEHAGTAAAWVSTFLLPSLTSILCKVCQLVATASASKALSTKLRSGGSSGGAGRGSRDDMHSMLPAAQSSACAAGKWAGEKYARLDPTGRLPAAATSAYRRARAAPGGAMLAAAVALLVPVILVALGGRG